MQQFCLVSAILSTIRADLPSCLASLPSQAPQKTAEPIGQPVEYATGESLDHTVKSRKRTMPIEADVQVVEKTHQAKRAHLIDSVPNILENVTASCDLEDDAEGLNSRWEASEELEDLLKVIQKPLQRFERRALVREFPRPASEPAFTPTLDSYLISMIQGIKTPDNSLKEVQDKILDALGPLCTMYENTRQ